MSEQMADFDRASDWVAECPFCGKKHGDPWDLDWSNTTEVAEIECENEDCEKAFLLRRRVDATYETAKPVESPDE